MRATEDIRYPIIVTRATQLQHVWAMLRLAGHEPPGLEGARVLEVGCAYGVNLAAMAAEFPQVTFIGSDIDELAISEGESLAKAAGLSNLSFVVTGDLEAAFGGSQFDYILAHGLFSWVSDEIKESILKFCASNLTPEGAVYLSYNCYPGWLHGTAIRDLLSEDIATLRGQERLDKVRAKLKDFRESLPTQTGSDAYTRQMKHEIGVFEKMTDGHLVGEVFSEHNDPFYFVEFCQMAQTFGLEQITDAHPMKQFLERLPSQTLSFVAKNASNAALQRQLIDFQIGERFRGSVLKLAAARGELDITGVPFELHYTPVSPIKKIRKAGAQIEVLMQSKASFKIDQFGQAFFDQLQGEACACPRDHSATWSPAQSQEFSRSLLHLMSRGLIEPLNERIAFELLDAERPCLSPLNRALGERYGIILNKLLVSCKLPEKRVAAAMDGVSSLEQIAERCSIPLASLRELVRMMRRDQVSQYNPLIARGQAVRGN